MPADWSTHSFVLCSVHEIHSTNLRHFISKTFILVSSAFLRGEFSQPYLPTSKTFNSFHFVAIVIPWFPHILSCLVIAYPFASRDRIFLLHTPLHPWWLMIHDIQTCPPKRCSKTLLPHLILHVHVASAVVITFILSAFICSPYFLHALSGDLTIRHRTIRRGRFVEDGSSRTIRRGQFVAKYNIHFIGYL